MTLALFPPFRRCATATEGEAGCTRRSGSPLTASLHTVIPRTHKDASFLEQTARRIRISLKRTALLMAFLVVYAFVPLVLTLLPQTWQLQNEAQNPASFTLQPFLFVRAADPQSTISFSPTPYANSMCPSSLVLLTDSTRYTQINSCPFYDLYYMLVGSTSVTSLVASAVNPNDEKQHQTDSSAEATKKLGKKNYNTSTRNEKSKDLVWQLATSISTSIIGAATTAATESSSFYSILKGPRNRITSYYEVLNTEPFFYMLTGCTIVISIDPSLAPAYAYNNFQSYVQGYRLTAPMISFASGSRDGTTPITRTTTTSLTTSTTAKPSTALSGGAASASRQKSNFFVAHTAAMTPAADTSFALSASGLYPAISLRSTFFYWNQPQLHCLLNAPVLMAMRSQLQMPAVALQPSRPAAAADVNRTTGNERWAKGTKNMQIDVCPTPSPSPTDLRAFKSGQASTRATKRNTTVAFTAATKAAAATSSASSFASCANYLLDPSDLVPGVDTNFMLTANYLQLSSNIILKIFSFDVWYQLANPPATATGPWINDFYGGSSASSTVFTETQQKRSFTKKFSSVPRAWRGDADAAPSSERATASATSTSADTIERQLKNRADAVKRLGNNLVVDPERVCSAPALYTVSLNAMLAKASSWSLGTSGDWLQTNITILHRYPAARAVAVVAQCSGVPVSFSVTATFTNPSKHLGSGQNYYTSIIYFLFLVCYALLFVVFLVLIIPCGKRRKRERELKQKDAVDAQEKPATEMRDGSMYNLRRHQRHQPSSRVNNSRTTVSISEGGDVDEIAGPRNSSTSASSCRRNHLSRKAKVGEKKSSMSKTVTSNRVKTRSRNDSEEPIYNESSSGKRRGGSSKIEALNKKGEAVEGEGGEETEMTSPHFDASLSSLSPTVDTESDVGNVGVRGGRFAKDLNTGSSGEKQKAKPSAQKKKQVNKKRTATTNNGSSDRGSGSNEDQFSSQSSSSIYSDGSENDAITTSDNTPSDQSDSNSSSSSSSTTRRHQQHSQRSHSATSPDSRSDRSRTDKPRDLYSTRFRWAGTADSAENCSNDGGDRNVRRNPSNNSNQTHTRHRPPFHQRCFTALTRFGVAAQRDVHNRIVVPMERWWKESYVIIMYSPLQWLLLVLIALKTLVCTLYSAKYFLMAESKKGGVTSNFSLFVVCVILNIATDTLTTPVEMLIGMGWGLAFTAPLPTNQIVIVCVATIGVFIALVFQATCDTDGFNLGLTANRYAQRANGGRCNSVTYARIGVEMACRLHNVLRMFLLVLWLSRSVIPADAAAVQRQRRLREHQLRHQQLGDNNNDVNQPLKTNGKRRKNNDGRRPSSSSSSASASSSVSAATQRGNGLTSNPQGISSPVINLSPPPRLGYPDVTLSAMDVYLRYQSMWAPFGMLLVWYILSITLAFTFFQPEDYYMVVAFREFQTFYLFTFAVLFLRTSSPEYT